MKQVVIKARKAIDSTKPLVEVVDVTKKGILYDEPAKNNSCEIVFLFLY